jgi:hypothetical protein
MSGRNWTATATEARMTDQQLERFTGEVLALECDRSAVLAELSDAELETANEDMLKQFGLELAIGVWENSEWYGSKLVIDANEGPISFFQTVFYAIRLEMRRRQTECRSSDCGGDPESPSHLAALHLDTSSSEIR